MHAIFFTGNTFHIGNILIQLVQSLYARITHTLVILDFLFQTRLLQAVLPSQYQVVLVKDANNRQEEQYRNRILIPSYTSQKVLHFTHTFYFDSFDFTKIEVLIDKFYHLIAKKKIFYTFTLWNGQSSNYPSRRAAGYRRCRIRWGAICDASSSGCGVSSGRP